MRHEEPRQDRQYFEFNGRDRPPQADPGNSTVRRIDVASANVTTLAGGAAGASLQDGVGSAAAFNRPNGVCVDAAGLVVFVAGELKGSAALASILMSSHL